MTDQIPFKLRAACAVPFDQNDVIPIEYGGTGVSSIAELLAELGIDDKINAASGIAKYEYENRSDLRTITPAAGGLALVDGLGLFRWVSGSTEPDDDESCFGTSSGRWLLACPHWDVMDTWHLPDDEYNNNRNEDIESRCSSAESRLQSTESRCSSLESRWIGSVLYGTAPCSITVVNTVAQASFTATITGAAIGDRVIANPPDALGPRISVFARVTATNTVTIYLNNPSATNQSLSAGTWQVAVFKGN